MIGIYKIENLINHKIYIGQSWKIEDRIGKHKRCSRKEHTYLYRAMRRYGIENFSFDTIFILRDGPFTQGYLDKFEIFYIKMFNSSNRDKGYNIRGGGSRGKVAEETKEKLRKIGSGRPLPLETIEKIRRANTGKHHTQETKNKMSRVQKGHIMTEETKIKISCSKKGKKGISEITKNKLSIAGKNRSLESKNKRKQTYKDKKIQYKKVKCIELNKEFESLTLASEFTNIRITYISAVLHKRQKTAGGYHWEYI